MKKGAFAGAVRTGEVAILELHDVPPPVRSGLNGGLKCIVIMKAMSKRQADPSPKEKPKISEQVQMEIVQKYLEEHYSTWPDIPLPALKGSTPRQAAASKQLRPLLEDLLKDFINRSERERRQGHPGYDFSKLARELGFDELA